MIQDGFQTVHGIYPVISQSSFFDAIEKPSSTKGMRQASKKLGKSLGSGTGKLRQIDDSKWLHLEP